MVLSIVFGCKYFYLFCADRTEYHKLGNLYRRKFLTGLEAGKSKAKGLPLEGASTQRYPTAEGASAREQERAQLAFIATHS